MIRSALPWGLNATPIGLVPTADSLNTDGLDLSPKAVDELLRVDPEHVAEQLPQVKEHLARFGDRLPGEVKAQLDALETRLGG